MLPLKYEYLVQVLNTTWMLKNKQTNKQKSSNWKLSLITFVLSASKIS